MFFLLDPNRIAELHICHQNGDTEMNRTRRNQIKAIRTQVKEAYAKFVEISEKVDEIIGEEQDYFDSMPENLQGSEKGYAAESAIEALEEIRDGLDMLDDEEFEDAFERAVE